MNVVVANKYQTLLANLNIEVMKTMYGEYDVEEIISTFQTFFYNRMILDITAIRNHEDIRVIQKLSISLDNVIPSKNSANVFSADSFRISSSIPI